MDIRWKFVQIDDDLYRVLLCPKSRPIPPQHSPHSKLLKKAHTSEAQKFIAWVWWRPTDEKIFKYKLQEIAQT